MEQFVSTSNGCTDSATAMITVEPITLTFVPNTFTPNEDDINDSWKPILSYIKEYQVRIFDRWGDLLYYGDDIYKGWNGRVNNSGTMVKPGQYFYKIEYVDAQGVDKELYGTVNLVR
jgi:gliding motility-associated-like protein